MKFLHVGDVHLGAEPEHGTALGALRKKELWEAFCDIIELCEQENVELLLIPGDLFHGQPLLREVKEVDYLFRRLTRTKVVMIAGNHDCLLPSSHYYDVTFPEHVTFLMDTQADSVYLPELNTEVFGLSYEKKQIEEARYDEIRVNDRGRINILLAHGNTGCNDKSIPIHRNALEAAGFDYVALGHLHNRIELSDRIAYSGSLEPLNRGETGEKGYIIGELKKEGSTPAILSRKFVPHAKREYRHLSLSLTAEDTERSVCQQLYECLKEQGENHMYLVTLTGTRARERVWNPETMIEILGKQGGSIIEIKDETVPDFCVEMLKAEHKGTLIGHFIDRMEQVEEETLGRRALQYGLQALLARDER